MGGRAVKILILQDRFRLGGQEGQTLLNARTFDRDRFEPVMAGLHRDGEHLRCHFLGHRQDVPALLAMASVAASASLAEGISNALLEAMALRLPVAATSVGGTPEIVRDGVSGFLVPPSAPPALARRLVDLLADAALRRRMGDKGRRIVEREFSVAQMRAGHDALYGELAGPRNARALYGVG